MNDFPPLEGLAPWVCGGCSGRMSILAPPENVIRISGCPRSKASRGWLFRVILVAPVYLEKNFLGGRDQKLTPRALAVLNLAPCIPSAPLTETTKSSSGVNCGLMVPLSLDLLRAWVVPKYLQGTAIYQAHSYLLRQMSGQEGSRRFLLFFL